MIIFLIIIIIIIRSKQKYKIIFLGGFEAITPLHIHGVGGGRSVPKVLREQLLTVFVSSEVIRAQPRVGGIQRATSYSRT